MKVRLTYIFFLLQMILPFQSVQGASVDSVLQHKMLQEQQTFLAQMKLGLQHLQMLAVRAAINGDDTQLQQIRQSRNHAGKLPDSLHAFYPTPNICI